FIWNGSSGSGALDMAGVNVAVDVFFEDVDDSKHFKWWGSYNGSQPILEVNYKDTKSSDIKLALVGTPNGTGACAGVDVNLTWDIQGKQTADCPDGTDDLETFWRLKANVINSLGITADTGEATDTVWGALDKTIGTKDEDLRTHYGVIIKDPDSNGDSDTVQLKIPSDQVFANVVLKGTATSVTSSGTAYVPAEVTPKTMLSSEVSDPTAYNLIIVGGPCANPLAETVFGIACADWSYAEGESLVKMVDNGEKVAMLVAGTTALDTRRACKAVGNYDEHSLTGSEVLVKGTTLSDITVESA
ncbi:MAG: hypothetical protein U9Q69_02995, partial [Nanoarchaeota archaeon]|nr:hypothetical protein [Nanoarchaeota archaeon]